MKMGGKGSCAVCKLLYFVVAVMVITATARVARVAGAINCNTVISNLTPCLSYVAGNAVQPSPQCCNGVRTVNAAAKTTADRRTACSCLKNAASTYKVNYGKIGKLPGICRVKLGYTITPTTNCATIP